MDLITDENNLMEFKVSKKDDSVIKTLKVVGVAGLAIAGMSALMIGLIKATNLSNAYNPPKTDFKK